MAMPFVPVDMYLPPESVTLLCWSALSAIPFDICVLLTILPLPFMTRLPPCSTEMPVCPLIAKFWEISMTAEHSDAEPPWIRTPVW